jgi:hypothetical protein
LGVADPFLLDERDGGLDPGGAGCCITGPAAAAVLLVEVWYPKIRTRVETVDRMAVTMRRMFSFVSGMPSRVRWVRS